MPTRILIGSCMLIVGCMALTGQAPSVREIELIELDRAVVCGGPGTSADAEWITEPEQLLQVHPFKPKASSYPWNPSAEGLLLIHMGTRPTGGYALEVAAPTAKVRKAVATIRIDWVEPEPGSFVTQALTAPCLLLKIPRGGIEKIIVKDQHDKIRFEVSTHP